MCQALLDNVDSLRLLMFGGKGGVGKTTAAAAAAIHLAGCYPAKKILLLSTDPAHSLADSLAQSAAHEAAPVTGWDNLWVREMSAQKADEEFRQAHGEAMRILADRGTYFDQSDIGEFLDLPMPGLDEVMAIFEIADLLKEDRFDLFVMDTAPTGHTLRLLDMPNQMAKWVHTFGLMQKKHRYIMRRFTGKYVRDDADAFLTRTAADVDRVKRLLSDQRRTQFVPVTIPEPLSIAETRRLIEALIRHGISCPTMVVNRVPPVASCPFCSSRVEAAADSLAAIENEFHRQHLLRVPLFAREVCGTERLTQYGTALFGQSTAPERPEVTGTTDTREGNGGVRPGWLARFRGKQASSASMADLLRGERKLLLFGGKGGVGKTSLSAATAVRMAQQHPEKRILIFSTDPAHSLSDSFDFRIGDRITRLDTPGQLDAIEMNSEKYLDDFRTEYRRNIEAVFKKFVSGGVDVKFDREVIREMISLSPPGLDELMALIEVMDLWEDYDLLLLDTAPTGHLLRFLEMPELARDYIKVMLRILIKYKTVIGLSETAQKLLKLSKNIRRVQETLTDPARAGFVAVTIPTRMALAETRRLLERLDKLGLSCRHLAINMVIPPTKCDFCGTRRSEQQQQLKEAVAWMPEGVAGTEVPLFPHPIGGLEDLRKLAGAVYEPAAFVGELAESTV